MLLMSRMLFVVVFFAFILSCTAESWQNQLQNDYIVGDSHRILSHDMSNEEKLAAIETLLKTRSHYHTNRCGNWKDNYLQQYKELMNKPEKERFYVIAIPNLSGMADRIIGFTTIFAFAMVTNRIFQIGKRAPLPNIEEVFQSPYIDWTRKDYEPEWIIEPLQHKAKVRNYNSTVLDNKQYFAVNTIDDWKLQDKFLRQDISVLLGKEYQYSYIVMNRGKTIRIFENQNHVKQLQETGMNSSTCFGCIVDFLIQPKPFIFLHTWTEFLEIRKYTSNYYHSYFKDQQQQSSSSSIPPQTLIIAIQIRTGDENLSNEQHSLQLSSYSAFFSCAQQIEEMILSSKQIDPITQITYENAKWYLVTDSLSLRKEAVNVYGKDKIITNLVSKIEHSSKESSVCQGGSKSACEVSTEGFATAAAEWWLMSYARYHVITLYSGYGRSAAMHSLYPNSIYTIQNKKFNSPVVCNSQTFTDLETLSYDWSGI